jgi:hypothetical protein
VTSLTSESTGSALAVSNSSLFGVVHPLGGKRSDEFPTPDLAYGEPGIVLAEPYDEGVCGGRDCQGYDPSQMWYYSKMDGMLRQSTYTASINHRVAGNGYVLTEKVPTWRHHCLAHTLSVTNEGSAAGMQEVWGCASSPIFVLRGFSGDGLR